MVINRVTIIIPSFNKGRYIAETIYSVCQQTYKNWELIIVDDGSNDNSCSLISEAQMSSDRIKFYRREARPKGASVCRNIGLKHATGEFVLFLDADDLITKNCQNITLKS